jgi:tripartite-type tricarboxylate transporter receptor subunit TctC
MYRASSLALAWAICLALGGNVACAQERYPAKPIKAYIPFSAGSATDIIPRAIFESLATDLGQPIVVENRGGAGGTIGVGAVVKADPDGYTILTNSSAHTVAPAIIPNLPYDTAADLAGVVMLGKNANVLVVSPAKGWKTAQEMVAAAKARPGTFNYGSAGVGTATHVSAERFRHSAGFEATHVPYKGGPEALADIFGGRIDYYYCPISTAIPLIRDGRILALAVSTPTRASALPDVPTSLELGYGNSDYTVWYGVFMPAKTPRDIVDKFHAATNKVLASPAMQERLKQLAVDRFPMQPAEIDASVRNEIAANKELLKGAALK